MAPFPERAVHRMAAVQEREHRRPAHSDFFERAPDAEIASRRNQPFFKGVDRFGRASGLVVHFRQIQIELGVVVLSFPALRGRAIRRRRSASRRAPPAGLYTKDKTGSWEQLPGRAGRVAGLLPHWPSRRFFRHSLKSFIPASVGDVVPIQWDIGSFLSPPGHLRGTLRKA